MCRNYVYYCVHLLCLFVYFKNVLALKTGIKNNPVFDIDIYTIGRYTVYIQKLFKKWMGRTIRMHTPLRTRSARPIFVEYAFRVTSLSTRPQTLFFTSV